MIRTAVNTTPKARTQAPAADQLAEIKAKAAAAGFDVTKLVVPPAAVSRGEKAD